MFTGLIEEVGVMKSLIKKGGNLQAEFTGSIIMENTIIGDSIAINGVCQTVTHIKGNTFSVDISSTTVNKTTFNKPEKIKYVNLERAMKLQERIGGHLVQGHVNDRGVIKKISENDSMILLQISLDRKLMKYIIDEGSVAIDGISLTVSDKDERENSIFLKIIPHTFRNTNLKYKKNGDSVNIETDLVGRYVESMITKTRKSNLSLDQIKIWGY